MPRKCRSCFFCFFFVFWHIQYIAPPKFCQAVCLEINPVWCSIFIRESHWHLSTSWRNKIILSAVYRVSNPATLPVLVHHDARESTSAKSWGCRLNHGVMNLICSGLSEIMFSNCSHLALLMLSHLCCFLILSGLIPSFIATRMSSLN